MKILISSRSFNRTSRSLEIFNALHYDVVSCKERNKVTEDLMIKIVDETVVGIIAGTEPITKKVLEKTPNLKVISRYGSGTDNIDLNYCKQHNIKIYTTTSQSLAVAEFTIALMLDLLKKISFTKNQWNPQTGNLLTNKIIGIIGYGSIGKEVERLLQPFNVKILKYDNQLKKSTGLQEIFEYSDVVTVHLPLTPETHCIINKQHFNMANRDLLFVNTSRGGIVDEEALYQALYTKQIAGAAVDVFEVEPYVGKLQKLSNVILTPHIASFTFETRQEMEEEVVNNLLKELK